MAIHQEVRFKASPEKIYAALTSGKEFGQITGAPAEVTAVEGQPISLFGGQITGRNIELVRDKSLVQAWRVGAWPSGVYSIVRITLEKEGNETKLTLDHTDTKGMRHLAGTADGRNTVEATLDDPP